MQTPRTLSDAALAQLFTEARTHHGFTDAPIAPAVLQQLYELLKWAPTSMNAQPARFVFVTTPEAKAKLAAALMPGNVEQTLAQLFTEARTHHGFTDAPIAPAVLQQLYELLKWAPTSMNAQPARFVFVTTPEAKAKLAAALMPGNVEQTLAAPVTVIVAWDTRFFDHLPTQFPAMDAKPMFEGNAQLSHDTAFRNSSLQGAYLIMAARALGLDVGPMSGFDAGKLNEDFFPEGRFKANFLCNLGHGRADKLYPRGPRLAFDEVCRVV